jgi:hypothetical protein
MLTYDMCFNNIINLIYEDCLILRFVGLLINFADCNILNVGQVPSKILIEPNSHLSFRRESYHFVING